MSALLGTSALEKPTVFKGSNRLFTAYVILAEVEVAWVKRSGTQHPQTKHLALNLSQWSGVAIAGDGGKEVGGSGAWAWRSRTHIVKKFMRLGQVVGQENY